MYHGDNLPSLSTYADALAWYESRQAYKRGRSKGLRPLGQNRKYDRSLISIGTDAQGVGSVILSYHNTPVITFYADNSVVLVHNGHETVNTMDFINAVLRVRIRENRAKWAGVTRRLGKLYFCDGMPANNEHRFETILKLSATNEVTGGATEYEWVLDAPLMARVRKHYAEFTEYLSYYSQMVGTRTAGELIQQTKLSIGKSDLRWRRAAPEIRAREAFFDSLDLAMLVSGEDKFTEFLPLAEQVVVNASGKIYNWAAQTYDYVITPQTARDFFYNLCRYQFAGQLFAKKVVEKNKVVLDENSKYVQYQSDASLPFEI